MLVTEMINRNIATIAEDDTLEQAGKMMSRLGTDWLVVMNGEEQVAGLVSWRDVRDLTPRQRKTRRVSELMLTGLVLADRQVIDGDDTGNSPLVDGYATPFLPVIVMDGDTIIGIISTPEPVAPQEVLLH